jgi:hypothetical protein
MLLVISNVSLVAVTEARRWMIGEVEVAARSIGTSVLTIVAVLLAVMLASNTTQQNGNGSTRWSALCRLRSTVGLIAAYMMYGVQNLVCCA